MEKQLINFSQILGQRSAIDSIKKAYQLERLPHGLIFAGPTGVGKETTARALAALFLCQKPKEFSPCGKCESCRAMDAEVHPDFNLVYRQLVRLEKKEAVAKELAADVIRTYVVEKSAHSSSMGNGKVFVIREADLMNATAQNTLLKTLEEPPGKTLIILLTDSPEGLLPTIRSRCQLVRFAPLDEKIVRQELEKRGINKEPAANAARFSDGSLGLALSWLTDGVIERAAQLAKLLEKVAAGNSAAGLQAWLKSAFEEYAEKQVERDKNISQDQVKREGLVLYFKLAAQYLRTRLAESHDDPEQLERICQAIDALARAEGFVESNVNLGLVLQQLAGGLDRALHPTNA